MLNKEVEFFYRKNFYIFPENTNIYVIGNKLTVEIDDKPVRNISPYLTSLESRERLRCAIGLPITDAGSRLEDEYSGVASYLRKNKEFDFLFFEYASGQDLILCTFFQEAKNISEDGVMNQIQRKMPYLVNIFKRPMIHLKKTDIIQAAETVSRIGQSTVIHLAQHVENWKNVDESTGSVLPARLLTHVYDDDYGIYENIVFRDLIDKISSYLLKRLYYLSEALNTYKSSISLDALSGLNHQKYFLSIGKLYAGFYQMENPSQANTLLEETKALYGQIKRYKRRDVYAKNVQARRISGEVKKTNILLMHKDYRHVYELWHQFHGQTTQKRGDKRAQERGSKSYALFCRMLALFAASNFNLKCETIGNIYSQGEISAEFSYKNWKVYLSSRHSNVLDMSVIDLKISNRGQKTFRYLLIPMSHYFPLDKKRHYENIIEKYLTRGEVYDKFVFLEPFEFGDGSLNSYCNKCVLHGSTSFYAVLPVSISDINSFRRIQKIIFEGMVLSNDQRDICAFCGQPIYFDAQQKALLCKKCRTALKTISCKSCKKEFTVTFVAAKNRSALASRFANSDSASMPDFYKQERQNLFRNIINMHKGEFFCPHCNTPNPKN